MKRAFFITIGVCFLVTISMCGDHSQDIQTDPNTKAGPGVKVTASVVRIRYCQGDNDVYAVHLRLTLRYTNLSSERAILYKSKQPIEIMVGAIAENTKALEEKRYEATLQYEQFSQPPSSPDSEIPSASEFTIIDPGSTYDLTGAVAVPVRFKPTPVILGTIAPGDHAMTVEVVDWPFAPDDGKRLRMKWANIGTLHYEAMETPPIQFSIPSAVNLEDDCSEIIKKARQPVRTARAPYREEE